MSAAFSAASECGVLQWPFDRSGFGSVVALCPEHTTRVATAVVCIGRVVVVQVLKLAAIRADIALIPHRPHDDADNQRNKIARQIIQG